jgi:predicted regulator of Ras-like GTPase activity (Roadblock/LC7/MglB family)
MMSKLLSISDVKGAGVVRADGSIVSWCAKDDVKPTQYIDYILNLMPATNQKSIDNFQHSMFTESITNYNGVKILTSRIREDKLLLLVLDKRAYLGLTMLDVECCLGDIDKVLDESCSSICETRD